jgi:hypothetical protein
LDRRPAVITDVFLSFLTHSRKLWDSVSEQVMNTQCHVLSNSLVITLLSVSAMHKKFLTTPLNKTQLNKIEYIVRKKFIIVRLGYNHLCS